MELPQRSRGDALLPAGALLSLRNRLRRNAHEHDLATVIACAFARHSWLRPRHFLRLPCSSFRSALAARAASSGLLKAR